MPNQIRLFLNNLKLMVAKCFPNSKVVAVGGFLFLRFICPAIFSPEGFDLITNLTEMNRRTLVLVAKVLQGLANGVEFKKEEYMTPFNNYIINNKEKLYQFLDDVAEIPQGHQQSEETKPIKNNTNQLRDLAVIVRYLDQSYDRMERELDRDPRMENLETEVKQKNRERMKQLKEILSDF